MSLNCFLRAPANTDNMLFFTLNYFDRQDYNDIRKAAATTLVMMPFSCHSDLHDGLKNLHSLVRKTLEVHRINLGRSLSAWFYFLLSVVVIFHFEWCWITRKEQLPLNSTSITSEIKMTEKCVQCQNKNANKFWSCVSLRVPRLSLHSSKLFPERFYNALLPQI